MKLFGYSISLNIVILIGIFYLIMVVNALSSSCNREGMSNADSSLNAQIGLLQTTLDKTPDPAPAATKIRMLTDLVKYVTNNANFSKDKTVRLNMMKLTNKLRSLNVT